jgi:hypothetical protein
VPRRILKVRVPTCRGIPRILGRVLAQGTHKGPARTSEAYLVPPKAHKEDYKLRGITPHALKLLEGRFVNPEDASRSPGTSRALP